MFKTYLALALIWIMVVGTVLAKPLDQDPTDPRKGDQYSPQDPNDFKILKLMKFLLLG
ncbi:hypothetical protein LSTR_LSTR000207 [Laodelphax striatellus]|uniref:Uncharacterized protein n=1 Tax=Laodelphax striatellus TaxID=195883 RepID=A0A482X713_LAOST|nr:hypothetical protein LSTR_LSTR000207 [Laodelphax striatellus]